MMPSASQSVIVTVWNFSSCRPGPPGVDQHGLAGGGDNGHCFAPSTSMM
jgi:hypothetical protein